MKLGAQKAQGNSSLSLSSSMKALIYK